MKASAFDADIQQFESVLPSQKQLNRIYGETPPGQISTDADSFGKSRLKQLLSSTILD